MYGLGIRLGFYIQWLAGSLAAVLLVEDDVKGIRSALFGFTLATFLAAVVEAAKQESNTTIVDIYVSLLLCFGYFYFFLVRAIWRLYLRARKIERDETKLTVLVASPEFDILQMLLLLAVTAMKIWFWATMLTRSSQSHGCPRYGFLFYPYWDLRSFPMGIPNIIIDGLMISPLVYQLRSAVDRYLHPQSKWFNPEEPIGNTYV